jgi:hypothetical protein
MTDALFTGSKLGQKNCWENVRPVRSKTGIFASKKYKEKEKKEEKKGEQKKQNVLVVKDIGFLTLRPYLQARMARGIHGIPKVSLVPTMPDLSTPCGQAIPETALRPFLGWSTSTAGGLQPSSTPLESWIPHAVRACILGGLQDQGVV